MKNIIIIGKMGSGKDTVAEYLVSEYDYKIAKLGFKIRKEVNAFTSILGTENQRRELYQAYGQTMRAIFSDDIWNKYLYEQISPLMHFSPFVIADCRQQNEVDYWMSKGFVPLVIHVEDEIRISRISNRDGIQVSEQQLNHETELFAGKLIDKVKRGELEGYYFDNSGGTEQLETLKNLLSELLKD